MPRIVQVYRKATKNKRTKALNGISFLRTWCKAKGKGVATTVPSKHLKGLEKYLRKWRLPIEESDQLLLVRNASEELWIGCGWMLGQGFLESGSSVEVSAARGRWRRRDFIMTKQSPACIRSLSLFCDIGPQVTDP